MATTFLVHEHSTPPLTLPSRQPPARSLTCPLISRKNNCPPHQPENGPNSRLQTPAHDAPLSKHFRNLVPLHLRQNPYNQVLVDQETKLDENDLDRPLRAKGVLIEVALAVPGGDHGDEARANDGGVEELGEAGSAFGGIGDCGLEFCWFRATSDVVV
jgi:hypothetical protein